MTTKNDTQNQLAMDEYERLMQLQLKAEELLQDSKTKSKAQK